MMDSEQGEDGLFTGSYFAEWELAKLVDEKFFKSMSNDGSSSDSDTDSPPARVPKLGNVNHLPSLMLEKASISHRKQIRKKVISRELKLSDESDSDENLAGEASSSVSTSDQAQPLQMLNQMLLGQFQPDSDEDVNVDSDNGDSVLTPLKASGVTESAPVEVQASKVDKPEDKRSISSNRANRSRTWKNVNQLSDSSESDNQDDDEDEDYVPPAVLARANKKTGRAKPNMMASKPVMCENRSNSGSVIRNNDEPVAGPSRGRVVEKRPRKTVTFGTHPDTSRKQNQPRRTGLSETGLDDDANTNNDCSDKATESSGGRDFGTSWELTIPSFVSGLMRTVVHDNPSTILDCTKLELEKSNDVYGVCQSLIKNSKEHRKRLEEALRSNVKGKCQEKGRPLLQDQMLSEMLFIAAQNRFKNKNEEVEKQRAESGKPKRKRGPIWTFSVKFQTILRERFSELAKEAKEMSRLGELFKVACEKFLELKTDQLRLWHKHRGVIRETISYNNLQLERAREIKAKYIKVLQALESYGRLDSKFECMSKLKEARVLSWVYASWAKETYNDFQLKCLTGKNRMWSTKDWTFFGGTVRRFYITAKLGQLKELRQQILEQQVHEDEPGGSNKGESINRSENRLALDPSPIQVKIRKRIEAQSGPAYYMVDFTTTPQAIQRWYSQERKQMGKLTLSDSLHEDVLNSVNWQQVSASVMESLKKPKSPEDCRLAFIQKKHLPSFRAKWTRSEIASLMKLGKQVEQGQRNWASVAAAFVDKTEFNCIQEYRTRIVKRDRPQWTSSDDGKLVKFLSEKSTDLDIAALELDDPVKNRGSVLLRWRKHLNPALKLGGFTRVEDAILLVTMEKLRFYLAEEDNFGIFTAYLPWRFETVWRDRANSLFADFIVPWTIEEDRLLLKFAEEVSGSKKWSIIADKFTTFKNRKGCFTRHKLLTKHIGNRPGQSKTLEEYHIRYSITRYNITEYKHLDEVEMLLENILKKLKSPLPPFPGYPPDRPPKEEELKWYLLSCDRSLIETTVKHLCAYRNFVKESHKEWRTQYGDNRKTFDRRTFHIEDPQSVASALHIRGVEMKNLSLDSEGLTEYEQQVLYHFARFSTTKEIDRDKQRRYLPTKEQLLKLPEVRNIVVLDESMINTETVPYVPPKRGRKKKIRLTSSEITGVGSQGISTVAEGSGPKKRGRKKKTPVTETPIVMPTSASDEPMSGTACAQSSGGSQPTKPGRKKNIRLESSIGAMPPISERRTTRASIKNLPIGETSTTRSSNDEPEIIETELPDLQLKKTKPKKISVAETPEPASPSNEPISSNASKRIGETAQPVKRRGKESIPLQSSAEGQINIGPAIPISRLRITRASVKKLEVAGTLKIVPSSSSDQPRVIKTNSPELESKKRGKKRKSEVYVDAADPMETNEANYEKRSGYFTRAKRRMITGPISSVG